MLSLLVGFKDHLDFECLIRSAQLGLSKKFDNVMIFQIQARCTELCFSEPTLIQRLIKADFADRRGRKVSRLPQYVRVVTDTFDSE